jgi:hypothetical protein
MKPRTCAIVGGGTVSHVRSHLAIAAPAYGNTARLIDRLVKQLAPGLEVDLYLTHMAVGSAGEVEFDIYPAGETPDDLTRTAQHLADEPSTKIVFWSPAIVDFSASVEGDVSKHQAGKYTSRLESSDTTFPKLILKPVPKILPIFRQDRNKEGRVRKDIFLVAFKTTCGATREEMYLKGLNLLKASSANLVLVNDVKTRFNMVLTPEEAAYHETEDREKAIVGLVDMAIKRSNLTFTQSTVVSGEPVPWSSDLVPHSLRRVVDHAIKGNAYKPFRGATVGHFACVIPGTGNTQFLTSIRKSNFNDLDKTGLVRIVTDGPDTVIAFGAKPSVGGQSQRQVFRDHEGYDCIAHFHTPMKEGHPDDIPVVSQRDVECGSFECGKQTSVGLRPFGRLKAVMLDKHGPNIVFPRDIDPQEVIDFNSQLLSLPSHDAVPAQNRDGSRPGPPCRA